MTQQNRCQLPLWYRTGFEKAAAGNSITIIVQMIKGSTCHIHASYTEGVKASCPVWLHFSDVDASSRDFIIWKIDTHVTCVFPVHTPSVTSVLVTKVLKSDKLKAVSVDFFGASWGQQNNQKTHIIWHLILSVHKIDMAVYTSNTHRTTLALIWSLISPDKCKSNVLSPFTTRQLNAPLCLLASHFSWFYKW